MLICNNCHHINDDHATQCAHCHMHGKFTHRKEGQRSSDEPSEKVEQALCRNCGSAAPGDGARCIHCNFPRLLPGAIKKAAKKQTMDHQLVKNTR